MREHMEKYNDEWEGTSLKIVWYDGPVQDALFWHRTNVV